MAEKFDQVGVELVTKNLDAFLRGMGSAQASVDSFTSNVGKSSKSTTQQSQSFSSLGVVGIALGTIVGDLAIKVGTGLVQAFSSAVGQTQKLAISSVMLAGRFQELEFTALAIGSSMGKQEQEVRNAINTIRDAGVRYDVASKTVAQFIRNNIDLANATDLVNIAQATGIIIGADSSDTLSRLTDAIVTGNTVRLRALQITVDRKEAEEKFAAELGKSVDALTDQEQKQARVNAIIEDSASLMDVYNAALQSPTKALRSFAQRELPEVQAAFGRFFLPAFFTGVTALRNFVKAINAAISEGGALFPILVRLGGIAMIVADGFSAIVGVATQMVKDFNIEISEGFSETIRAVFEWGVEISFSLAEGIIQGASSALVSAMNFIGGMLSNWLAPGSPPRVAPDIDKWGGDAMVEWLRGFSTADFNILENLQGILRKVLDGPAFRNISTQITGALSGISAGVAVPQKLFANIAKQAGKVGPEIAELARRQIELAVATREATQAQQQLDQAQNRVTAASGKVRNLTSEYNRLLREGASDEILQTRLAEINAAEQEEEIAQEQVAAAESAVEAAEDRIDPLKERAELQERLIKQLLTLSEEEEEVGGAAGKAAGGAANALKNLAKQAEGAGFAIKDSLLNAMTVAKKNILVTLGNLWTDLKNRWKAQIRKPLDLIKKQWKIFTDILRKVWDKKIAPIIDEMVALIPPEFFLNLFKVMGVLALVGIAVTAFSAAVIAAVAAVSALTAILSSLILPVIITTIATVWQKNKDRIVKTLTDLRKQWFRKLKEIKKFFIDTWNNIKKTANRKIEEIKKAILKKIKGLLGAMGLDLEEMKERWSIILEDIRLIATEIWSRIKTFIQEKVSSLASFVTGKFESLRARIQGILESIKTIFRDVWNSIIKIVRDKVGEIFNAIITAIENIAEDLSEKLEPFIDIGKEIIDGIVTGILKNSGKVIKALTGLVERVINAIKEKLDISSPSKVFFGFGQNIALGLAEGIKSLQSLPALQVEAMAGQAAMQVAAPPVVNTRNITMNSTVRSEMDLAILTGTVKQVLRQELGA